MMRKVSSLQSSSSSSSALLVLVAVMAFHQHQQQQQMVQAAGAGAAVPLQVHDDNVEETLTGRKASFIMFYGSECEDCEDMTPEWNRLAELWEGHDVGQIAQVDCESPTAEGLCDFFQIQDIPTLVFGGSMEWDFYHGSHDFESLSEFATRSISKPICTVNFPEHCDETELALIEILDEKTTDQLIQIYDLAQTKMKIAHDAFSQQEEILVEKQTIQVKLFRGIFADASSGGGEYDFKLLTQVFEQRVRNNAITRGDDHDEAIAKEKVVKV